MQEKQRRKLEVLNEDTANLTEFFQGFSVPRNQEIMRIFKDLDLVEYLGSGIPRILQVYPEKSFNFTENFLRMTFPNAWNLTEDEVAPEVTTEVAKQVEAQVEAQVIIKIIEVLLMSPLSSREIAYKLGHKQLSGKLRKAIPKLRESGIIEYTIPNKPSSHLQKYSLTEKGKTMQKQLEK